MEHVGMAQSSGVLKLLFFDVMQSIISLSVVFNSLCFLSDAGLPYFYLEWRSCFSVLTSSLVLAFFSLLLLLFFSILLIEYFQGFIFSSSGRAL